MEWRRDDCLVSDDRTLIDRDKAHAMIARTYWAEGRTREKVHRSIDRSLCLGLYHEGRMIGFARAVTDRVFFSWIMDLIIEEEFRGRGLGKWLTECLLAHPDIRDTKVRLSTKDAHGLYEQYGFTREECMARPRPE